MSSSLIIDSVALTMKRFFLLLSILVLGWMFFANYSKVELDEILHDSEIPVSTKGRSGIEVRSHDRPRVSEALSPQEAKIDLSDAESKTSERKPEGDGFIKKVLSEKLFMSSLAEIVSRLFFSCD